MKVTVKDCLELSVFTKAVVAAGRSGLENKVSAISFIHFCKNGHKRRLGKEVMLLGDYPAEQAESQHLADILQQSAEEGEGALVLFSMNSELPKLSQSVLDKADEIRLPIILMPPGTEISYAEIVHDVMEEVLYGGRFANRLINNTIFHLLNFEKHSNFQSAVREAAINNNFQIVLLSEDFNPIFSVETRHKVSIAEAIRSGIERDFDKSTGYTKIDVNGALTYWGPVSINGEKHFMCIVDNEDFYSPGEITKLAEIVELAMGMWKYSPVKDAKAEFIKALRRGNVSLAYSLKDEAGVEGENILSVFCATGLGKDDSFKKITSFEKNSDLEVLKIHENDELYGMVLGEKTGRNIESCISLYLQLGEIGADAMFHVTDVEGIEGSADAYHLINEAWPFIRSIFPYKNMFTKYELALTSNCINISLRGDRVKKNYMELLNPFKMVGDSKGRQLLDTLEIFVLDADMNTARTAKMMDIHTNTVQYRLKKIREVLQADLMETTVIPGLTVALAIERIEKIMKIL